jgi:hypothetical protein
VAVKSTLGLYLVMTLLEVISEKKKREEGGEWLWLWVWRFGGEMIGSGRGSGFVVIRERALVMCIVGNIRGEVK